MDDLRVLGAVPMVVYLLALVVTWKPRTPSRPTCWRCGADAMTSDTAGAGCGACGARAD